MAVLVVNAPGQDERVVPLAEAGVILGRDEGADVVLDDPKVSQRHLRLAPDERGRGWVAEDLGSTHGTRIGPRRILRVLLGEGDELLLGQTRVRLQARAPSAAKAGIPLVSGTLDLRPVPAAKERPAPPPAPAPPVEAKPPPAEAPPPSRPRRPADARSMGRAFALVVAGLLVLVGVELLLRPVAQRAEHRAEERKALRKALERMDLPTETFQMEVEDFLEAHPEAEEREALIRYLAALRAEEAERVRHESELNAIAGGLRDLPESELRARLLELQRTLPHDEDIVQRIRLHLDDLNRRHEHYEASALEATIVAAEARLGASDPAGALRRLTAFRAAWPSLSPEAYDRLRAVEDRAIEAARALSDRVLEEAERATDALARRRMLGAAWRGLAGTPQGERVADALRFVRTPGRPSAAGATPPGPGATPGGVPEPETPSPLLQKAAEAERLAHERQWPEALVALKELVDASEAGPLQREWLTRSWEIRLVLDLVGALGKAAASEVPPRPKLSVGRVKVLAADAKRVEFERGGVRQGLAWSEVEDADLLALLAPTRPTPYERLGLAVLAAGVGRRDDFVRVLVPLFEEEKSVAEASDLVARYLYGRAAPPAGGYRAYEGEILDQEHYERRRTEDRIVALRARAEELFAKLEKESAFKKLAKLKALRHQLDERRQHALLAIFNEKHYPYPYVRSSEPYREVQKEIDRRVALVREIWDDPLKVKIGRKGSLERTLDAWDEALAELKRLGGEVADLEEKGAAYTAYVTGEPLTIRDYFRDAAERKLLEYNRWVMEVYNPEQDREAREAERQQTRVTNEYRMMMGYAALVTPGPAPYEAIDEENVVKIVDEGRIQRLVPLFAVRIDDRLVRAARAHSLDMQKRGFFAHRAPRNPATGEPATMPWDRMKREDYQGAGASENICAGASSPEQAHARWCHSSGHHRNILSPWHDQGVGKAGRLWTQNYGTGGGGRPAIVEPPPPESAEEGDSGERAGDRGREGR